MYEVNLVIAMISVTVRGSVFVHSSSLERHPCYQLLQRFMKLISEDVFINLMKTEQLSVFMLHMHSKKQQGPLVYLAVLKRNNL